jgi:Tfp pilus assembly protein PilV
MKQSADVAHAIDRRVASELDYVRRKTDEDVERVRAACAEMSQRDSLAAREARDAAQAEALKMSQRATEVQVSLLIFVIPVVSSLIVAFQSGDLMRRSQAFELCNRPAKEMRQSCAQKSKYVPLNSSGWRCSRRNPLVTCASCSCSWTCTGGYLLLLLYYHCVYILLMIEVTISVFIISISSTALCVFNMQISIVVFREKLDAVRSQLQMCQAQATLEKSELKSALDAAEEKLRQLSGLEQQLGSIITDAAAAGADVLPFTDVLQAAAIGSKGRVAQVHSDPAHFSAWRR